MAGQPFDLVRPELLPGVERLVVESHAALHRDLLGERWTPPDAYRWIRYEDPDPAGRLIAASRALEVRWEELAGDPRAVGIRAALGRSEAARLEELVAVAVRLGFSRPQAGSP